MFKFSLILIIGLLLIFSCNKDKKDVVADFTANFKTINTGEKVTFTDKSKNNPETWNWIFNGGTPIISEEQNPEVTYSNPGIYSVSLTVTNYLGNSSLVKSEYIKVVEFECGNDIIDTRDDRVYQTVSIGNRCWLKQSLNTGLINQSSNFPTNNNIIEKLCFNNDEANCQIYGALYTWNEMLKYNNTAITGICPTGFIIPSKQIFEELITFAGDGSIAGGKLKQTGTTLWNSPNTGATDAYGFTALPSGYLEGNVFLNINRNTIFWTSDSFDSDNAFAKLFSYNKAEVTDTTLSKNIAVSVRCMRNNL